MGNVIEINRNDPIWNRIIENTKNKPLQLKTQREVAAFMAGKSCNNLVLEEVNENINSNDSYKNSNYLKVQGEDNCFDISLLLKDKNSYLKGNLDDQNDIDYYNFRTPYKIPRNNSDIQVIIEFEKNLDAEITLYDQYGNQVGKASNNGDGQIIIDIPNWDTKSDKYCIKIKSNRESKESNVPYKMSFKVNEAEEKNSDVNEAFLKYLGDFKKGEDTGESLSKYNQLLIENEYEYKTKLEELHWKQYNELPEEDQYKGDKTVDELLELLNAGEKLNKSEMKYLEIFFNLKDFDKAQKNEELQNNISAEFTSFLNDLGLDAADTNFSISIDKYGKIQIDGLDNKFFKKINEEFGHKLYEYYSSIAESVIRLSKDAYKLVTNIQEIERFLFNATDGKTTINDLYMKKDCSIGGLPESLSKVINEAGGNVKYESLREIIKDVLYYKDNNEILPEYTASFEYSNGVLKVVDNGIFPDIDPFFNYNFITEGNPYYGIYAGSQNVIL